MSFAKKTWVDRVSQYPNRRTINDGYTTKQVTVGRDEGTVTEAGDSFSAENMNDLESRIATAIGGTQGTLTAGENIDITANIISVTDVMTANDAHTLWANA